LKRQISKEKETKEKERKRKKRNDERTGEVKERNKTGNIKSSLCLITPHTAKKVCGSGGTFPPILNLGTGWR
jgi:hypothetical protein